MVKSKLLETLVKAAHSTNETARHTGRIYGLQEGICTNNQDPEGLRRIKVTLPSHALTESNWLLRANMMPNFDPPLPEIGDTVLLHFVNGNSHKGYWFGVATNARNPGFVQENSIYDSGLVIPGHDIKSIRGDSDIDIFGDSTEHIKGNSDISIEGTNTVSISKEYSLRIGGKQNSFSVPKMSSWGGLGAKLNSMIRGNSADYSVYVDGDKTEILTGQSSTFGKKIEIASATTAQIRNGAGCAITLEQSGLITVEDAFGRKITIGGSGSDIMTIDLKGGAIKVTNCSGYSINGKEIATIGSVDDDGDKTITRGW